jgi:hypothetical protein
MEKNESDGAIYEEFVKFTVKHIPNFVTQWGGFIPSPNPTTQTDTLSVFLKARSHAWHPEAC